jgi:trehalose-6-phosphate synthase
MRFIWIGGVELSQIEDKSEKNLEFIKTYLLQNHNLWPIFLDAEEISKAYNIICSQLLPRFFSINSLSDRRDLDELVFDKEEEWLIYWNLNKKVAFEINQIYTLLKLDSTDQNN